uniref:Putative vegetative cell wall protein gp1 n=1 Tax=Culex tarsalis TaxID=7177 RepID=A0A1Q3FK86_CULTA
MDIISTLADILMSHPKRKKVPTENPTPSTSSQTVETITNESQLSPKSAQEPKPKSSLNLERILSILQSTQKRGEEPQSRGSGSPDDAAEPQPSTSSASVAQPASNPAAADPLSPHQALLTKDAIRILMPTLQEVNTKFNVEKQLAALNATAAAAKLMPKTLPPGTDTTEEDELEEEFEEEEEQIEYKFTPRPVFLATNCQVCKNPLRNIVQCETCRMVSYCNEDHRRSDLGSHKDLCAVIVELATRRGGHIYNMAHKLTDDEYRNLRVHTLNQSEQMLRRPLQAFEREILLFPRTCCSPNCREWRQNLLSECKDCRQVSFCTEHPDHLPPSHKQWCKSYFLFQKLILRQKILGRIEPVLPVRIASKSFTVPPNIDEVIKLLYKNSNALRDECVYATLTQIATGPLTALHGYLQTGRKPTETFTIHLVGAELQFEGDTLDKWEAFFLHIVPEITELRVVFVGPELNVENLPIDIISRIRMCRRCRLQCRNVKFDFQCRRFYHDFWQDSTPSPTPDLICFFNPGLHRSTGFGSLDTWPKTIAAATGAGCPLVVTAYTEYECPLDLARLRKESKRPLELVQPPVPNPFASQRPERNFISEQIAPMIFKNYYYFVVK